MKPFEWGVLTLGVAVAEAIKEASRAGTRWWAVVFNRRNHTVDQAFVVISLEQYTKMLRILDAHGWLQ